ncbi:hypothetical protein DPMN_057951 [Dreissena polymorpha]|uniref:Uncharacterized protein n=1 Tax=Dreissena polymorpha TaxID=45954 RepID=A0A9D4C135_DREPO|nr:hypothetical protein DPMN_057951 [Dreissena polymorpha]
MTPPPRPHCGHVFHCYIRKMPCPLGHVFPPAGTIFKLIQDIIGTNRLTKKNALPLGSHVFKANVTIFKIIQHIFETNLLTKFHDDWTITDLFTIPIASQVFTRKHTPPPGGHVFKATKTIFILIQNIIKTNLLTKFHEDRKINVASRVLTSETPAAGAYKTAQNSTIKNNINTYKNKAGVTALERSMQSIGGLNRKNALPHGGHVLQQTSIIF